MSITFILKRDGRKQKYDRGKIAMAIWKSLFAVSRVREKFAKLPTSDVKFRKLHNFAAELVVSQRELDKLSPDWQEAVRLTKIVENILIRSNGSHHWKVEEIQDVVEQVLSAAGQQDAAQAYILYRNSRSATREREGSDLLKRSDPSFLGMSDNAYAAMAKRYLWKDKDGNVIETPKQTMSRVATAVAASEKVRPWRTPRSDLNKFWRNKYLEIMTSFEFVPAGCYFRGAGNKQNGSLANCFVLPVEDSIEKIFDAVKWAALIHQMGGGCVAAGSKVFTSFCGLENIEILYERLGGKKKETKALANGWKIDVDERDISTLSFDLSSGAFVQDKVKSAWRYELPAHRVYTIHAQGGLEITTSDWHPFFVYNNGHVIEKRADKIQPGDLLISGNNSIASSWPFRSYHTVDGIQLNENIGWLVGYILGDGSFGETKTSSRKTDGKYKRMRLFDGRPHALQKAARILSSLTRESLAIQKDPRSETYILTCGNQRIVNFLQNLTGIMGPKDSKLSIPSLLIKEPQPVILAMLAGLLDSDRHVAKNKQRIEIDSESLELIDQVSSILTLFGICAAIRKKSSAKKNRKAMWQVRIDGHRQITQLANAITPYMADIMKRERLLKFSQRRPRSKSDIASPLKFLDFEPFLVKAGVKTHSTHIHKHPVAIGQRRLWLHRLKGNKPLSVSAAIELLSALINLEVFTEKEQSQLMKWQLIHQSLVPVINITRPEKGGEFYDFTTERFHNYLAGRHGLIVVHNTGFNFSHLRPRGDVVGSGGLASGPINFMKAFDAETQIVMQGGEHRGANMGILNVDHPDIFEFIRAKSIDGEVSNFNISVGVFDKFMKAVEQGSDWPLVNPRDKSIVQKIPARQLWQEIISLAHKTGDPGMIYLDTINKFNPIMKALGPIEATNVCGEQVLHPFDVCFSEETRILTSRGYEEIMAVHQRQKLGSQILVATHLNGKGNEIILRPAKVIKTGKKKTVMVTLWNGQQIRVTPNHEIHTKEGWKQAGKLTDADYVMIQNHMGGELVFDAPNEDLQLHHLFGWFSGDGWFTNDSCGLTFGPQDTFAFDYLRPLWQEFSEYQHRVNIQKNFVRCLASQKRSVMEKFRNLGFTPAKAFDKRVPASVMISTKQRQIAYLQGLFAADGSVVRNKPAAALTSASYLLLRDVQLLLLDLGIHSHIRHYYGERPTGRAWAILQVSGESFRRFMDLIGFPLTPYKQLKAKSHISRRTYRNREFIQVRTVEPAGITEVYDVSEPETNSLIAEGMVVHNCNLGSINLSKFIITPWWEKRKGSDLLGRSDPLRVNWTRLEEVVRTAVRFLDDGIDASTYPIPQISDMAHQLRRIGLGVMGWADMLAKLGVRYDSDEGVKLAEKIMKFIQQISWDESHKLSKEKGVFPLWKESYFNSKNNPFGKVRQVRNVAVTTIAPTGTISMIADCSSGIEPYFALEYTKNVVEKQGLKYTNKYYEEAKKTMADRLQVKKVRNNKDSTFQPSNLPTFLSSVFRTAHQISPDWHVKMQAAFQKYTDNAVSKTINFSREATVKDVEKAYMLAWKLSCKGITVYRDGSRENQILKTAADSRDKKNNQQLAINNQPSQRLMQSQMTVTPLSQRAYRYERRQIIEESVDGHCPECGAVMEETEGCSLCRNCGFSKCSI